MVHASSWLRPLLDLIYPEICVLCGAHRGEVPWEPRGARVRGLRRWDVTHLCRVCSGRSFAEEVVGRVGDDTGGSLVVAAAARTHPDLVRLVGQFKYHHLRGLAWPLARRLVRPDTGELRGPGRADALVPVPLHRRRRRSRGFNQAALLARLLARRTGLPVLEDVLIRVRNTGQQAKLATPEVRRRNLFGAYRARPPLVQGSVPGQGPPRICLVDDLVTSGWTMAAAAVCLREAGWRVTAGLALGLAVPGTRTGPRVDTWRGGF